MRNDRRSTLRAASPQGEEQLVRSYDLRPEDAPTPLCPTGRGYRLSACAQPSAELEIPRPFTVVLADDQRAYREGLARAIAHHSRLELVGVAGRGDDAFRAIESLRPDVALIDVRMGGMAGTGVCELLRERHPELATQLVLMSADGTSALESEPGVDGFVAKDRSRREICEALVEAAERPRVLTTH
jgi:CheY-like chemotaxis protein